MTAAQNNSGLNERIKGGAIFGGVVIAGLVIGGYVFAAMMAAAAAISIYEWAKMVLQDKKYRIPLMIFGVFYIGFSIGMMVWLRNGTAHGLYNMLTLLMIIWASDISAYFSGKAIGGPKLAPMISPKKTWAGFFGSSVGAAAVAAFLASPWVLSYFNVITVGKMSVESYAMMGFILGMFGQAGDLFISVFKRHYGVKDTGNIIPGHGGILDRIDALLLVAPMFAILTLLF